jgi:signal transduction histidine kinase
LQINPDITPESWAVAWAAAARDRRQTFETQHRTKDGRLIPVEVVASHLEVDGVAYSCSFARDITERRQMERRVRQAEKMEAIGQLAGGIAHDFNNQLAGIVGYADILLEELAHRPHLLRLAEGILTSAKRASSLTSQLLAFSRQGKYLSTPVDLHPIIDEVVDMLGRSIDKRIRISTKYDAERAVTVGDPTQLQNAVLNLALNARDAMPEGGELTFATALVTLDEAECAKSPQRLVPGRYVLVRVIDTGTGMDAQTQDRLFEPFFTTKEKGKGTGLGLAAVYGTLKNHKGAIHVASEVGRGTEMRLYLPLAAPSTTVDESIPDRRSQVSVPARVLLVEDEETVSAIVSEMLERLGCQVRIARNGPEAIKSYRQCLHEIDVVLLDLVMPEMSGKDTFVRLRAIHPSVKVIIASGHSLDGEVQSILDMGARGFLQKPFRSAELASKIAEVMAG